MATAVSFSETAETLPNATVRDIVVHAQLKFSRTPGTTVRNITGRHNAVVALNVANDSLITNNTFSGTEESGGGISVSFSKDSVVTNNVIWKGQESDGRDIRVWFSNGITARQNHIHAGEIGIHLYEVTDSIVSRNVVQESNDTAIQIDWESQRNVFEGNVGSDSVRGISVTSSYGNTFRNTTMTNVSEWAFYVPNNRTNVVDDLSIGSATLSSRGANIAIGPVSSPPSVLDGWADLGHYVLIERLAGDAWISLNVNYDQEAIDDLSVDESTLRLYRHSPRPFEPVRDQVYAALAPCNGASGADNQSLEEWSLVQGTNGVNTTPNTVYANVTFGRFIRLAEGNNDSSDVASPLFTSNTVQPMRKPRTAY